MQLGEVFNTLQVGTGLSVMCCGFKGLLQHMRHKGWLWAALPVSVSACSLAGHLHPGGCRAGSVDPGFLDWLHLEPRACDWPCLSCPFGVSLPQIWSVMGICVAARVSLSLSLLPSKNTSFSRAFLPLPWLFSCQSLDPSPCTNSPS